MIVTAKPAEKQVSPLFELVCSALDSSPHVSSQRIRFEAGDGKVKLHGRASSFFEKQMAQEAVRRVDGVERVENLIEVAWA